MSRCSQLASFLPLLVQRPLVLQGAGRRWTERRRLREPELEVAALEADLEGVPPDLEAVPV